jgi:hypothetical protein
MGVGSTTLISAPLGFQPISPSISKDICTADALWANRYKPALVSPTESIRSRSLHPPPHRRLGPIRSPGCSSSGDEEFHERRLLYSPHYRSRRCSRLSHVRGPRRRVNPGGRGGRPQQAALESPHWPATARARLASATVRPWMWPSKSVSAT